MAQSDRTKVAVMQERIRNVEENVDIILTNHLPHLKDDLKVLSDKMSDMKEDLSKEINRLNVKVAWYVGIAVGIVGIINLLMK